MLKDTFRDFTWFDDAATTWMYTFPSVINMMTGELYDGTLTVSDYVRSAWESDQARNFYDALKTAGYERRLYAPTSMLTSDLSQLEGYFDNVSKTPRVQTINGSAFKNLLKLSLYRYFPLMMKAPFWIYTEDIVPMLGAEEETFDPWTFVNHFHQKGMSLSEGEKIFSFIYTQGVHAPFYLDEEGKMVQGDVSSEEVTQKGQLIGHLNVLRQVFAQMRSLGVYDDATIIVLGDHGNRALDGYDPMPFFWIKLPHVSQSEIQVNHAPITIQEQLIPTIAELIGQSAQVEGESVFAITENEPRERCSRLYCEEPSFPRLKYERNNAFLEVCWEGDGVELERRFEAGEGILYPVKDVE